MEQQPISPKSAANFRMIDISQKVDTHRTAIASGYFYAKPETILMIKERRLPKGDVLILCEVAGIQAAKRTIDLLPLCHPLYLSSVRVWCEFVGNEKIKVNCETQTVGKTGVEMEALCGATAALLCIYDLAKGVDPVLRIGDVQLEFKEGGKSGVWRNPNLTIQNKTSENAAKNPWASIRTAVLTVSDRGSRGEYEDRSGAVITEWLTAKQALLVGKNIVGDEREDIQVQLEKWIEGQTPDLIITTGGTGLSPRDITPEAILELARKVGGREVSGIGENLRSYGSQFTKNAWLSRSVGVQIRNTLVVCLPGSPKGVKEGLEVLEKVVPHALKMMGGGDHEKP